MISVHLVSLVRRLQRPELRQAAALELAANVGATQARLFGRDPEVGVYLPAPGLPQTLRQGARWHAFLDRCAQDGKHAGTLPAPDGTSELPAFGMADCDRDCIMVFLNAVPDEVTCDALRELLPLLGAKLIDERIALAATGHANAAREGSRKARLLNDALEKNRHELREAIERAERELASRRAAENQLLDADRRKDNFLATLAHELRNPLGVINSAVAVMQILDGKLPLPLANARSTIKRQVDHLTHLVDDLLDVSRISNGKVNLRLDRIRVSDFVSAAVEQVQAFIESRQHQLTIIQPDHPIWIIGDGARLSQIVGNLLHNAAKYTPRSGKITVAVSQTEGKLDITVRDDGIGIPYEAIDDIFHMFSQAAYLPDRVQDGLGVGLALVKGLVALHGGTVTAASDGPGLGSVFKVNLPIQPDFPPKVSSLRAEQPVSTRGKRILLVDDNEDAVDMMKTLLELEGHHIRTAYNGSSAIEAAKDFSPDIVCLDIGLPNMNGYQVARKLREIPAMNHATLIAITGMGLDKDRQAGTDAGFDHYMLKPLDLHELTALINSLET